MTETRESQSVTVGDALQVLLTEYSSLRDEVLQRDTSLNQILIYCSISIIAIASFMFQFPRWLGFGAILLIVDFALAFIAFKMVEFDVQRAAERMLAIETIVNEKVGERLMVWEADRGLGAQGYRYRVMYVLRGFAILFTLGLWKPRLRLWY